MEKLNFREIRSTYLRVEDGGLSDAPEVDEGITSTRIHSKGILDWISTDLEEWTTFVTHHHSDHHPTWTHWDQLVYFHGRRAMSFVSADSDEAPEVLRREYTVPISECFRTAAQKYPGISINAGVMAGAPCIAGTRIPVYAVLSALATYGSFEAVTESYPRVGKDDLEQAIGFSSMVMECPVEHEASDTH